MAKKKEDKTFKAYMQVSHEQLKYIHSLVGDYEMLCKLGHGSFTIDVSQDDVHVICTDDVQWICDNGYYYMRSLNVEKTDINQNDRAYMSVCPKTGYHTIILVSYPKSGKEKSTDILFDDKTKTLMTCYLMHNKEIREDDKKEKKIRKLSRHYIIITRPCVVNPIFICDDELNKMRLRGPWLPADMLQPYVDTYEGNNNILSLDEIEAKFVERDMKEKDEERCTREKKERLSLNGPQMDKDDVPLESYKCYDPSFGERFDFTIYDKEEKEEKIIEPTEIGLSLYLPNIQDILKKKGCDEMMLYICADDDEKEDCIIISEFGFKEGVYMASGYDKQAIHEMTIYDHFDISVYLINDMGMKQVGILSYNINELENYFLIVVPTLDQSVAMGKLVNPGANARCYARKLERHDILPIFFVEPNNVDDVKGFVTTYISGCSKAADGYGRVKRAVLGWVDDMRINDDGLLDDYELYESKEMFDIVELKGEAS